MPDHAAPPMQPWRVVGWLPKDEFGDGTPWIFDRGDATVFASHFAVTHHNGETEVTFYDTNDDLVAYYGPAVKVGFVKQLVPEADVRSRDDLITEIARQVEDVLIEFDADEVDRATANSIAERVFATVFAQPVAVEHPTFSRVKLSELSPEQVAEVVAGVPVNVLAAEIARRQGEVPDGHASVSEIAEALAGQPVPTLRAAPDGIAVGRTAAEARKTPAERLNAAEAFAEEARREDVNPSPGQWRCPRCSKINSYGEDGDRCPECNWMERG